MEHPVLRPTRPGGRQGPRPRRRPPSPKKGGKGVALLIVGLVVGIPLLIFVGVGVWIIIGVRQVATKSVTRTLAMVEQPDGSWKVDKVSVK